MIDGYIEGSNISILNTIYIKPHKKSVKNNNGDIVEAWTNDYIILVYVDNNTGITHHTSIADPEYTYYITKEGKAKDYNQLFIPKEDTIPITVKYRNLMSSIAKNLNREEEYKINKANGDYMSINDLNKDPRIFFSDMSMENYYRFRFDLSYTNEPFNIKKGFFDIEVDQKYQAGLFPELGECPINCLSYCDEYHNTVYTFILRNKDNPLIEEFENSINSNL